MLAIRKSKVALHPETTPRLASLRLSKASLVHSPTTCILVTIEVRIKNSRAIPDGEVSRFQVPVVTRVLAQWLLLLRAQHVSQCRRLDCEGAAEAAVVPETTLAPLEAEKVHFDWHEAGPHPRANCQRLPPHLKTSVPQGKKAVAQVAAQERQPWARLELARLNAVQALLPYALQDLGCV